VALLSLCQGFVFPSHLRSEAFGLSLVEAAMAGKPMISCEIGTGTTYINRHGETGLVVPPSDAPALAQAMHDMMQSPERTAQFGQQARQRYLTTFMAERMSAAYAALYRDLLSSG
jgi:O-antigen biosynthesis rhamnosyltransferase